MSDQLTPTRLRELIAAATPGPWTVIEESDCENEDGSGDFIYISEIERSLHDCEWADRKDWKRDLANANLITYMATHAAQIAEALEAMELLEWLREDTTRWGDAYRLWDGECNFVDALRAAKEVGR